jgi:hypothetical protein
MKYYVSCGSVNVVIAKPEIKNHLDAAIEVALYFFIKDVKLGNYVNVSELGFGSHIGDKVLSLQKVLKKAGFNEKE